VADHRGEFGYQPIRNSTRNRQVVLALKLFDRRRCGVVQSPRRLDLTVAVFGQSALHGGNARGWVDQIGDWIVPPRRRCRLFRRGIRRGRRVGGAAGRRSFWCNGFERIRSSIRRLQSRFEGRHGMHGGLQEGRVHDDDEARADSGENGERIHRTADKSVPGANDQSAARACRARRKCQAAIAAVTHLSSPLFSRSLCGSSAFHA